jgi:hypothetical protein
LTFHDQPPPVWSAPAHHQHSQRCFEQSGPLPVLPFEHTPDGLIATAPDNGFLAPPGYYMLFLVDVNGVPSVAKVVRLQ